MSSSLEEVASQISLACETADRCRRSSREALEPLQDAVALFTHTMDGSVDPETERVHAFWRHVVEGIQELDALLAAAANNARTYAASLAVAGSPASGPKQPEGTARQTTDTSEITPDDISGLRRELPPPITSADAGRKTHGRWKGPDGIVRPIVSGVDDDSKAVHDQLVRLGVPGRVMKNSDVEMKLAARMVREGIKHASVLINNVPCRGRLSCDTLVPIMLPEGSTLTVHGINPDGTLFRKRYTGGVRPWWR